MTGGARDEILRRVRAALADVAPRQRAASEGYHSHASERGAGVHSRLGCASAVGDEVEVAEPVAVVGVAATVRAFERLGLVDETAAVELFAARLADYDARVHRLAEPDLPTEIAAICAQHGVQRIAIPPDLPAGWAPAAVESVVDDGVAIAELDGVDGTLTGCALAIAETGTLVFDGGATQGRRALTLIPDLHICVVRAAQIVVAVPQAVAALRAGLLSERRPVTFVSGPSATSDIEFARVTGVHGPRRLEVVLVE